MCQWHLEEDQDKREKLGTVRSSEYSEHLSQMYRGTQPKVLSRIAEFTAALTKLKPVLV